jgi:hypothetical protein
MMLATLLILTFHPHPSYHLTIFLTILVGIGDSFVQTALFPTASSISPKHLSLVMMGNGASGLLVSGLKLICKSAFSGFNNSAFISSRVYFGLASSVLIIACCALQRVKQDGVFERLLKKEDPIHVEMTDRNVTSNPVEHVQQPFDLNKSLILYKRCAHAAILPLETVFTTFIITLALFPGALTLIKPTSSFFDDDWFVIAVVGTFNLFDWIGRGLVSIAVDSGGGEEEGEKLRQWLKKGIPKIVDGHSSLVDENDGDTKPAITKINGLREFKELTTYPALCRLIFFVLIPLVATRAPVLRSDLLTFLITAIFAVSNGWIVATCMVVGSQVVEGEGGVEAVNLVLLIGLFTGLAIGATVGLGVEKVLESPKPLPFLPKRTLQQLPSLKVRDLALDLR